MAQADVAAEVELVRSIVGKYFPIYDVRVSYDSLSLYVSPDPKTLGVRFDELRKELKAKSFIPMISYSGGEHIISVVRMPEIRRSNVWINWVLLVATFFTTALAGMTLWADYSGSAQLFTLNNFLWGSLFFAIPLMTILGVHEYCHYLMSKRHGVEASLPFFIPSIPPFGTFGAFISLREPMPDRKALVDIGVAGPLGGLAVSIPVALLGLYLTANGHPASGAVGETGAMGVVIQPLLQLIALFVPVPEGMALHPLAFAAWVGFLVTAINLLPVGQLDGGHIARGLFGEKAKYVSYATAGVLFALSLFVFEGWLLFALLVLLLGIRHPAPLNDISKLDLRTKGLGILAILILLVTFVPQPIVTIAPDHSFTMEVVGSNNTTVAAGGFTEFHIQVNNTGNTDIHVKMTILGTPGDWGASVYLSNDSSNATNHLEFDLPYQNTTEVTVMVHVSPTTTVMAKDIELDAYSQDNRHIPKMLTINVA